MSIFLGQALSPAERDHYLVALSRALVEADEIEKWLKDNPTATVSIPATAAPMDVQMSPYYVKWFKFQDIRPDMRKLKDRLANPDATAWSSITPEEHVTFGWVSVVDQIFSAFKADPKNLTVGKWQGDTRVADGPAPKAAEATPTILGIPTKTAVIGGVVVVGLGILLMVIE